MINTKKKEFKDLLNEVSTYLQLIKGEEIREKVAKRKTEGGLNLINLEDRIQTLKTKQILEADQQIPETDDIIYMVGTNDKKIYDIKFDGPKQAINTDYKKKLLNLIIQNEQALKNYKKRHKKYVTKDLQSIIFPKEKRHYFGEIFNAKEPKLVSLNYLIVHGLLPIRNNKCYFCKTENESIKHIYFECTYLIGVRQLMEEYLKPFHLKFDRETILEMKDIPEGIECLIISQYKYTIWLNRNRSTHKETVTKVNTIKAKIEQEIRFYAEHILYCRNSYKR